MRRRSEGPEDASQELLQARKIALRIFRGGNLRGGAHQISRWSPDSPALVRARATEAAGKREQEAPCTLSSNPSTSSPISLRRDRSDRAPNVGKSTLMNACWDQKLSITSRKPQTTRQSFAGFLTTERRNSSHRHARVPDPAPRTLNRMMNRAVGGRSRRSTWLASGRRGERFGAEDRSC